MADKTNTLPIDTPSTYEVQEAGTNLTDRDLGFAKEKNEYKTSVDLAKQQRNIGLDKVEEDTHNDADDLAESSDHEYQDILHNLPSGLQDINKQLRFTARRGKTKEIRQIARGYRREFVKDMKYTCRTLGIYFRKLKNGRFDENMITPAQMQVLNAKVQARHDKIKGFIGDTLTGDNILADRGKKKDNFVGPDMNVHTDGVDIRGVSCTPAEAEAAMGRCQGGGSLAKQERCKFIEEKTGIRQNLDKFLTPTGSNIVTGAVKMIPTILQVVGGWKAIKAGFGLIFKGGDDAARSKLRKDLAIGATMFGAVTFLDPTKSYETLRNTFGDFFGKGKTGEAYNSTDDMVKAIETGSVSNDEIQDKIAPQMIGNALAGITFAEMKQRNILKYNGEKIVGINFDRLKGFYSDKKGQKDNDLKARAEMESNAKKLEMISKKKGQENFIAYGFDGLAISKDAVDSPENDPKSVGGYAYAMLRGSKYITKELEKKGFEDLLLHPIQSQQINEYVRAHGGIDKFLETITALPSDIKDRIFSKDINFEINNGKLLMNANGQKISLDLITHKIGLYDNLGQLQEFGDGAQDNIELINLATVISREIQENKGKFMLDEPLFYQKGFGQRGHKIFATTGGREFDKPLSRVNGKTTTIIDADNWFGDHGLAKFKDDNILERFTSYLNKLHIWKGETAQAFIDNELKARIASQYPTLTPSEHEEILKNYLGLYNTRGNLGALLYNNGVWAKDKAIDLATTIYTYTKELLQSGWDKLKTAVNDVKSRTIENGKIILTFVGDKTVELRDWLKGFYPQSTIDALKKKFKEASDKQRGVVGKSANWITDFMFGIQLFGENKNTNSNKEIAKITQTNTPQQGSEQKEIKNSQRYQISKRLIPNDDFYSYLESHANGSDYINYMNEIASSPLAYTNDNFVRQLSNGSWVNVENSIITKFSQLKVIQDYQKSKNITTANATSGLKRNISIRARDYRPNSKKVGYWIHGAAESVVSFGANIVSGIREGDNRNGGVDSHGNPLPPPNPDQGTPVGKKVGSAIRTGFGWARDGAKWTVDQGKNVITGGATNAFDGDKDNAKDIK